MMSNIAPFRPRRNHTHPGAPPHSLALSGGTVVELADTGTTSALPKPDDAEILKAIGELSKKLTTVTKNQKVLENKLHQISNSINNTGYNVVNGFVYLDQVMWDVGWWVQTGDADSAQKTWPKTPHWY